MTNACNLSTQEVEAGGFALARDPVLKNNLLIPMGFGLVSRVQKKLILIIYDRLFFAFLIPPFSLMFSI
jgi:hypothetical protein